MIIIAHELTKFRRLSSDHQLFWIRFLIISRIQIDTCIPNEKSRMKTYYGQHMHFRAANMEIMIYSNQCTISGRNRFDCLVCFSI